MPPNPSPPLGDEPESVQTNERETKMPTPEETLLLDFEKFIESSPNPKDVGRVVSRMFVSTLTALAELAGQDPAQAIQVNINGRRVTIHAVEAGALIVTDKEVNRGGE